MIFRRYGTFTGGIDLPDEKRQTLGLAIQPCRGLRRLLVPLAPFGSEPGEAVVRLGQRVRAGEPLTAGGTGAPAVLAPLAGRVAGFTTACVVGGEGFVESPAVELGDLSAPAEPQDGTRAFDWSAASQGELLDRIAAGHLATHRRPVVPVAAWVDLARSHSCRMIIANVLEQEPYVTADHRLLVERGAAVVEGLAILAKAVGAGEALLAADRRRTGDYGGLAVAARRHGIATVALPHKYPIGADTILTKVLTGRESPPGLATAAPMSGGSASAGRESPPGLATPWRGGETMAVGVAVIDAATCLAVQQWVVCGVRLLARAVTLAGPAIEGPANVWAPFGAPCSELVGATSGVLIHGGPMTALRCPDSAVVGPATNAVLAMDPAPPPAPGPCIRCGWCTDHCPARLNVAAMNDAFELSLVRRAREMGVMACVECGVCSYVCPARLPLAQRVRRLKRAVRQAARTEPAGVV